MTGHPSEAGDQSARERRAQVAVRLQRVTKAGLAPCARCGGVEGPVDDASLACDCEAHDAARVARLTRRIHEHLDTDDQTDRMAP